MVALEASTTSTRHRRLRRAPIEVSQADRVKRFRRARRHSALVRLLRIALPLAAVASFALYLGPTRLQIPIGDGKLTGSLPTISSENLKMEHPRYEGFTKEGGKFVVAAKVGYQDFRNPDSIRLEGIEGQLQQPDGQQAQIVSDKGVYESKASLLRLEGNIKVTSSNGMTAFLRSALVQVKDHTVESEEPVAIETSTGNRITADRMKLNAKAKEVVFDGNVRSHFERTQVGDAGTTEGDKRAAQARSEQGSQ